MGGMSFKMYSGGNAPFKATSRPDFLAERERTSPASDSQAMGEEIGDADEQSDWQQRWRRQRRRRRRKVREENGHIYLPKSTV